MAKKLKQPFDSTENAADAKGVARWENEGGAVESSRGSERPRDANQRAKLIVDMATVRRRPTQ